MTLYFISILLGVEGLWPIDVPNTMADFSEFKPQIWKNSVVSFQGCSGVLIGPNRLFLTNQHCIKNQLQSVSSEAYVNGFAASNINAGILWPVQIDIEGQMNSLSLLFVPNNADAFKGGEALNWNWPRQSADFAIFKIHTKQIDELPSGLPINSDPHLEGDKVMVLGYPAQTMRWTTEDLFQSSQAQVMWETNLQNQWATQLKQAQLMEAAAFVPDSRLQYLSKALPIMRKAHTIENHTQCYPSISFELYYLSYLQWSSKYLDCAVQSLSENGCDNRQNQLNPQIEHLLLRTTLSNDPFTQKRSRRWKRRISPLLNELPTNVQTDPNKSKDAHSYLAKWIVEERNLLLPKLEQNRHYCQLSNPMYPDADRSLRYSFGFIEGHTEGVTQSPQETNASEKNNTTWINFVSSADISRGSSGSPTLNDNGEMIGLVFDMDQKALISDWLFQADGRTIHVDTTFMIEYLEDHEANWISEALRYPIE